MDKKPKAGQVIEVVNFERRHGANAHYQCVLLEFPAGKGKTQLVPHLFSDHALNVARVRAANNPEDLPNGR